MRTTLTPGLVTKPALASAAWLTAYLLNERVVTWLVGDVAGLDLAVVLWVVTPFCSCSSIPLFTASSPRASRCR